MTKHKTDEFSRRDFLGVSIGAAVLAGIGCADDSGTPPQQGTAGQPGNGGATTGNGGAATGNGGATTGNGGATTGNGGAATGNGGAATGGATSTGATPLVALARDTDVAAATQAAIAKIGLPDLTGKVVVIRPNQIDSGDGTTNPEVIRGVIQAVKAASSGTVKQIIVAEDPFAGSGALGNMQATGVSAVCTAEGATAMELRGTATTNYKPATAAAWGGAAGAGLDFYNTVYNAEYLINVPRCKTHGSANFSMALKAWFGSVKRPSDLHGRGNLMDMCAEAHLVKKEDFVVIDATKCMVTGGPQSGTMMPSNLVIASKDAIAADVTGLAVIRYFGGTTTVASVRNTLPWAQRQITRALALQIPGWLTAQQDFPYWASATITEAAAIMAKRTA